LPRIDVEGADVAYEERGKGSPLVLLHGWNGTRKQWLANLKSFAHHFRVIAPDLPGFGESELNRAFPYTRDGMASFLEAFRQAIHLSPFYLLGHSMGGCIAVRYTASHPHLVRKLVLVSTPTSTASLGLTACLPGAESFLRSTYGFRKESILKWMFYRALYQPEYQDLGFVHANVRANALISKRGLSESIRVVRKMNLEDDLRCIDHPTLIIFGDKDRRVNPREAERQRRLLPAPYLAMITTCGHCPPFERPQMFNELVTEFLLAET
jgi:abhydrolase domain-containing protein 6